MQIDAVYRKTQTIFPVTNADLRGRDRADAECKHSYNTRTYAPRSMQEYKRHSFTQFGLRTTAYGNLALHHIVSDIEGMLRAA